MIVDPVIVRPLTREWQAAKAEIEGLISGKIDLPKRASGRGRLSAKEAAEEVRARFLHRLANVWILDPACGSGREGLGTSRQHGVRGARACGTCTLGRPRDSARHRNQPASGGARPYHYLDRSHPVGIRNSFYAPPKPILKKLDTIECPDALLKASAEEASWPEAEFVGNPPFLGGKLIRRGLGDEYVDTVFEVFDGRVPPEADLVTYWFEKTRAQIAAGRTSRGYLQSDQYPPARASDVLRAAFQRRPHARGLRAHGPEARACVFG